MPRLLSHSNKASVSVAVVQVVEPLVVGGEAFHHELDGSRSICCKHNVSVVGSALKSLDTSRLAVLL
jgi:hypothetical protein